MSYSETFTKARKLLEDPERWTQDPAELVLGDVGPYCARTALMVVKDGAVSSHAEAEFLAEHLPEDAAATNCPMHTVRCLFCYNDDKDTTHDDIMALYDRAIEASKGD